MSSRKCTTNHISYNENKNTYNVYYNGKIFTYSVSRYRKYAKKLAEKSLRDGRKYFDYNENYCNGITIFYVNTKKYGIMKVYMDTIDANKFYNKKISISKDKHAKTYYAKTKDGSVHSIILNNKNSNYVIDHIDRNGLNNRRNNIRLVTTSINNRNSSLRNDNKSGYKGIIEEENRYRLYYRDNDYNRKSLSVSKLKHGEKKALAIILKYRDSLYKQFDYIA